MQQRADNMTVMALELCHALAIDVASFIDIPEDQDSSGAVSDTLSQTLSEMDISDDCSPY
jgi:hypothetical protein